MRPQVADNLVDGVLAQLVERLVRNEKVRGSNPLGSTNFLGGFIEKTSCFLGNTRFLLFYPQIGIASCAGLVALRRKVILETDGDGFGDE